MAGLSCCDEMCHIVGLNLGACASLAAASPPRQEYTRHTALVYRFQNRNVGALSATAALNPTSCVLCCNFVYVEASTKVPHLSVFVLLAQYTVVIVLLIYNEVIERVFPYAFFTFTPYINFLC